MELKTEVVDRWKDTFSDDTKNVVARNAMVNCGVHLVALDSVKSNKVNHRFMNTLKRKDLKATNQGSSGRCWMFAGLNTFRHILMEALNLKEFEFSETYLFFWDKLERSNAYLQWFIDNPTVSSNSRYYDYMREAFLSDGGYWTTFANLSKKYGLVPKEVMPETAQSGHSDDMNDAIMRILNSSVVYIQNQYRKKNRNQKRLYEELIKFKQDNIHRVYNLLVQFLGSPPQKFEWFYTNEETNETNHLNGATPLTYLKLGTGGLQMDDFTVLMTTTNLPYYRRVEIKCTEFMKGHSRFWAINLPKHQIRQYTKKSIMASFPVWFAGDVSKGFEYYSSSLDEELLDYESVFGKNAEVSKKDKVKYKLIQGNHAMMFCGFNMNEDGKVTNWQVENSWGYWDEETPGMDGFLSASDKWFEDNVVQIVIHKGLLTRAVKKVINTEPIVLEPWNGDAPAMFVKGVSPPKNYLKILREGGKKFK